MTTTLSAACPLRTYPASLAQRHRYVAHHMDPDPAAQNVAVLIALPSDVDLAALHDALLSVVERHESLRTHLEFQGNDLLASVTATPEVSWLVETAGDEAGAARLMDRAAAYPFDLGGGPLLRAVVVRGPGGPAVVLTTHRIAADDESMRILADELAGGAASAASAGSSTRATAAAVAGRYSEHAVAQASWLAGAEADQHRDWWRAQLPHIPRTSLSGASGLPGTDRFRLDAERLARLDRIAATAGVSVETVLLAAFMVLIARYGDHDDVLVCRPWLQRDPDRPHTTGPLSDLSAVRVDLADQPVFSTLVSRLADAVREADVHGALPFAVVMAGAASGALPGEEPVALPVFRFHDGTGPRVLRSPAAEHPLSVDVHPDGDGLVVTVTHRLGTTGDGFAGHYDRLLDSVDGPDAGKPVVELPIVSDRERAALLAVPSVSTAEAVQPHARFAAHAERRPEAVALTCAGTSLTYGELDTRANRLAHHLRGLGVGPDTLVGLSARRGPDLIVAVLAIAKAGGAYVPLDPTYPAARLAYLSRDAGIHALVSDGADDTVTPSGAVLVDLRRDAGVIAACPAYAPEAVAGLDDLAYVIYTSGSTGTPKGALVTRRNVTRLFDATHRWFGFDADDVWTLFHSYAFDFSVWEIWGALGYGGRLVITPHDVSRSPADFRALLAREGVTVLNQTPSAFRLLAAADREVPEPLTSLRYVIFGGEALEPGTLAAWADRYGLTTPQLINMYGITETTVHVTYHRITADSIAHASASVIGVPIPDLRVILLDRHGQPVPHGVDGEVHVAGPGVARGYLRRPELDAQRFVSHPLDPRQRLYRSGDLARRTGGGELEYRGRVDEQVKIRGFRIELGEVQAALLAHPEVSAALVAAEPEPSGGLILTCWAVAREDRVTVADLRAHLATRLPGHMIPASLTLVGEFPMTAHGKIDRARLAATGRALRQPAAETSEADTAADVLRQVWAEVLGHDTVGPDDNYFLLGGDSIRTIQVLGRTHERGWTFPLAGLLRHQTIRELAEHTVRRTDTSQRYAPLSLVAPADRGLLPAGVEDAYPLSRLQAGMLYHSGLRAAERLYHNVSSYRLRGPFSRSAWEWTIATLLDRHPILRTRFDLDTFSEPLQLVQARVNAAPLTFDDLRGLDGADLDAALRRTFDAEAGHELAWDRAPLIRFRVLRRRDDEFQLIVTEHHAILDGWSERSMLTEIVNLYLARLGRRRQPLPEPPASRFGAYIAAERAAAASEDSRRFWSRHLDGYTQAALPRLRPPAGETDMRMLEFTVAPEVSTGLTGLARRLGVPLRILALSAHGRVMSLLTGGTDVVTGVVHHGRTEERDGDRVLGMFLNTLPMRLRFDDMSWAQLIARVAATDLDIQPHRRVPMPDIRDALGGQPLFETYVNFTHFHVYESVLSQAAELEVFDEDRTTSTSIPFGAEFSVGLDSSQLLLGLRFDAREFTTEQIEAIGGYYQRALQAMQAHPHDSWTDADMLSDAERAQLAAWNDTEHPLDPAATLAELLRAQALATPDAIAVTSETSTLTYAELDHRTSELARVLAGLGAGPGRTVAVALPRSPDLVVALVAIVRAGAAYLPLDPDHPRERLRVILDEARPVTTVCTTDTAPQGPTLVLDDPTPAMTTAGVTAAGPDDPAYVIYTSGSTGRPKGVVITHRAIVNRLLWMQDRYRLRDDDRVLQKTPATFDVSVWEFFWPLITGATLVVARAGGHRDPAYLADLVVRARITTIHFVPSMLRAFLAEPAAAACTGLRRVFSSGEALQGDLQNQFLKTLPVPLHNLYGPTEAAIDVTEWTCRHAPDTAPVPIGHPVWNTRIHLLDAFHRPVPVGVIGELHISGVQVAAGYLGNAELTAERFVNDPFAAPGARMYRTGDLARRRTDGAIEYLGRVDQQVKVRGFRIELGEIESVLSRHRAVADAAVLVRDQSLVAYVVRNRGEAEPQVADDQLADWRDVYDNLYRDAAAAPLGTDFSGWVSSYTGAPIPVAEMREWRDATVARIRALQPQRILEIGVGTGLLLAPLAPECVEYWGTDISATVIAALSTATSAQDWAARVTLRAQPAHVTEGLPEGHFDTIVLNSVVQYFPDGTYLTTVLERLSTLLAPGGRLFLGDVRDLRTLREFHRDVERTRTSGEVLDAAIEQRLRLEKELVIAPDLFATLPGWTGVDVRTRQGSADNELTRHRYDVILHTIPVVRSLADLPVLKWGQDVTDLDAIAATPGSFRVTGVPNSRLSAEPAAPPATAIAGLDEKLHGRQTIITWSGITTQPGDLDIVLIDADTGPVTDVYLPGPARDAALHNDPAAARRDTVMAESVRAHLNTYLPEYMVPGLIVIRDELPLTGSGKLDRRELATIDVTPAAPRQAYRAPVDATDSLICTLVADIVGVTRAGLDDNFFDLGGHSLLAFRLIARIRSATGVRIDVQSLFEAPTVADIAALVTSAGTARSRAPMLALRKNGRHAPLFCVHPAAGTGSVYATLLPGLDPQRPVHALQSTGQDYPHLDAMAANYLDRMRKIAPRGPYHLLGWSFGGIMAHALATRLQAAGERIGLLTIVDAYPAPPNPTPLNPRHAMAALLTSLGITTDTEELGPDQALELATAQGHPIAELGRDRLAAMATTFAANVALQERYAPARFIGDALLIESDPRHRLASEAPGSWSPFITGTIDVHRIDVAHGALLNSAPAATIAAEVTHRLSPPPV